MAGLILGSIETGRFRYTMLTTDEIAKLDSELKDDDVVVSHVGDGEYSHNIFGNVFSNYTKALENYTEYLKTFYNSSYVNNPIEAILKEEFLSWDKKEKRYRTTGYYIGKIFTNNNGKHSVYKDGRLTVETLNGEFNGGN